MSPRRYVLVLVTVVAVMFLIDASLGRAVPARLPLAEVPFEFAGWTGRVEPIEATLLQRARPDDVLHRRYTDATGGVIFLYIGYYERQASRGQTLAVCGDCQVDATGVEVIDVRGDPITVNYAQVHGTGGPVAVLYWYQQGRRVIRDAVQGKVDQAERALLQRRSDGSIVRISAPISSTGDDARVRSVAFVKALLPVLRQHFPE